MQGIAAARYRIEPVWIIDGWEPQRLRISDRDDGCGTVLSRKIAVMFMLVM